MKRVRFKEDTHQYFSENTEYISATTIIGKYTEDFDGNYWSTYKAVKDVLSDLNKWDAYKKQCGGWESVVKFWTSRPIHTKKIMARKKYYLDMWEANGEFARAKGNVQHKEKEREVKGHVATRNESSGQMMEYGAGVDEYGIMEGDFTTTGIYAEVLIWNDQHKIAGQIDRLLKKGRHIDLEDFKTNKVIKYEGFRGRKMKAPLQEFQDCSFSHYTLQLSLYAWMLAQQGYQVGELHLRHIPAQNIDTRIKVPYRPDAIEKMINHYERTRNIFR
jgi:hypothetical protein